MIAIAACVEWDIALLRGLSEARVDPIINRGLVALQGPKAETVLARLLPDVTGMRFMDMRTFDWHGADLWIARSGYTGEDGFEASLQTTKSVPLPRHCWSMPKSPPPFWVQAIVCALKRVCRIMVMTWTATSVRPKPL